jgi:hypothetical protein
MEYLRPQTIAAIIFDGDRSHPVSAPIDHREPGKLKRFFNFCAELAERLEPEEEAHSLRSARQHLRDIGFNARQVGIIEKMLMAARDHRMEHLVNVHDGMMMSRLISTKDSIEMNDRYYLGMKAGGRSLKEQPQIVEDIRKTFISNLDDARKQTPRLLFTHLPPEAGKKPLVTHRARPR